VTERDLVDGRRTVCLCDVGLPDYVAVTAVGIDGAAEFWLARMDLMNHPDATFGNANQPHEQLGRLPREVRDAIWGDRLRCGRPTAAGKPCRVRVAQPGDTCGQHRAKAATR
jgi:hypothetical protein